MRVYCLSVPCDVAFDDLASLPDHQAGLTAAGVASAPLLACALLLSIRNGAAARALLAAALLGIGLVGCVSAAAVRRLQAAGTRLRATVAFRERTDVHACWDLERCTKARGLTVYVLSLIHI